MIEVNTTRSSMFKKFVYSEPDQILIVTFSNGGEYRYFDVPLDVFNAMLNAESEGKYFTANIKIKFKYEKV